MKHKKYLLIVATVVAIFTAAFAALYFTKKQEPTVVSKTQRKIFLTNTMPYDGGACSFYVKDASGSTLDDCVSDKMVDEALKMLPGAEAVSSRKVYTETNRELLKIDADIRIEVEKRTPSTPKPQYSDKNVYYAEKIYSVELVKY